MRLPRFALLVLCTVLTAAAYYLILFTNWGNYYYGATYLKTVVTEALVVLAVFSCVEVMRSEKVTALRAIAGAVGVPLFLVMLLIFWQGVRRYVTS